MQLPIYIDEKQAGVVTIAEEEDGVRLSARLRDPGRVVRLTLYGGGELYLGIPVPSGGMLVLEKLVAPGALPPAPAYAAERPAAPETPRRKHVIWLGGRAHYF